VILLLVASCAFGQQSFQQRLIRDVSQGVEAWRSAFAEIERKNDPKRLIEGYGLSAMVNLHARTGDSALLAEARREMLWSAAQGRPIHAFHVPAFIEAYLYLRSRLTESERARVEALIRLTMRSQYDFPDWGAHNRSVVQANGYYYAAKAMPADPEAPKWRLYGDALISESWGRWSVEDASMYQSFWLFHMLETAEAAGRVDELMNSIPTRFYFEYYSRLMLPNGLMPDFGDADWWLRSEWYFAVMTRAGSYYRNGRYLHHARRFYEAQTRAPLSGSVLYCAAAALKWLDPAVPETPYPLTRSEEALEDLVGKKIVFRNPAGAYLLLNYRDQGAYGRYTRDHLNQVLAAYEEKPHHGHADENSITHLMEGGTLLLGDGGYRPFEDFFGGWRADVFHNRIVARAGWPMRGDVFDYLAADKLYREVTTEKVHFARFGPLDYSRTRLRDPALGYTADRIILFVVETGMTIVVDSIRIDREGRKVFANVWHPENILSKGEDYVVSWPKRIGTVGPYWENPHTRDLLIHFLDTRDKFIASKLITRRYNPSEVFYEYVANHFFAGQRLVFTTVLAPHAAGTFRKEMLDAVRIIPGSALGLEFSIAGKPVTVGLKLDQTIGLANLKGRPMWDAAAGTVGYGKLRTDADFAFAMEDAGGGEFGLMYATRLEYGGKTAFEMPVTPQIYQGPFEYRVPDARAKMPFYRGPLPR